MVTKSFLHINVIINVLLMLLTVSLVIYFYASDWYYFSFQSAIKDLLVVTLKIRGKWLFQKERYNVCLVFIKENIIGYSKRKKLHSLIWLRQSQQTKNTGSSKTYQCFFMYVLSTKKTWCYVTWINFSGFYRLS